MRNFPRPGPNVPKSQSKAQAQAKCRAASAGRTAASPARSNTGLGSPSPVVRARSPSRVLGDAGGSIVAGSPPPSAGKTAASRSPSRVLGSAGSSIVAGSPPPSAPSRSPSGSKVLSSVGSCSVLGSVPFSAGSPLIPSKEVPLAHGENCTCNACDTQRSFQALLRQDDVPVRNSVNRRGRSVGGDAMGGGSSGSSCPASRRVGSADPRPLQRPAWDCSVEAPLTAIARNFDSRSDVSPAESMDRTARPGERPASGSDGASNHNVHLDRTQIPFEERPLQALSKSGKGRPPRCDVSNSSPPGSSVVSPVSQDYEHKTPIPRKPPVKRSERPAWDSSIDAVPFSKASVEANADGIDTPVAPNSKGACKKSPKRMQRPAWNSNVDLDAPSELEAQVEKSSEASSDSTGKRPLRKPPIQAEKSVTNEVQRPMWNSDVDISSKAEVDDEMAMKSRSRNTRNKSPARKLQKPDWNTDVDVPGKAEMDDEAIEKHSNHTSSAKVKLPTTKPVTKAHGPGWNSNVDVQHDVGATRNDEATAMDGISSQSPISKKTPRAQKIKRSAWNSAANASPRSGAEMPDPGQLEELELPGSSVLVHPGEEATLFAESIVGTPCSTTSDQTRSGLPFDGCMVANNQLVLMASSGHESLGAKLVDQENGNQEEDLASSQEDLGVSAAEFAASGSQEDLGGSAGEFAASGSVGDGPEATQMEPCPHCGRTFGHDALVRHKKICIKVFQKKRRVFDAASQRAPDPAEAGGEFGAPPPLRAGQKKSRRQQEVQAEAKPNKWREKSRAFRDAMRAARGAPPLRQAGGEGQGEGLIQEPVDDRVPCPHCGRKFGEEQAARHIPICQRTRARPAPVRPTQQRSQRARSEPPNREVPEAPAPRDRSADRVYPDLSCEQVKVVQNLWQCSQKDVRPHMPKDGLKQPSQQVQKSTVSGSRRPPRAH